MTVEKRLTWGEFKEKMQQRGVTDGAPLEYIDWSCVWDSDISVTFTADGGVCVLGGEPR